MKFDSFMHGLMVRLELAAVLECPPHRFRKSSKNVTETGRHFRKVEAGSSNLGLVKKVRLMHEVLQVFLGLHIFSLFLSLSLK